MLSLKTCLLGYTIRCTCTGYMSSKNTARHKSPTEYNAARLIPPSEMFSQTEPSSLLPYRMLRHQYEMAHHDQPGMLSAESFFAPTTNTGMTCALVHVTRTSLRAGLNTSRCCAVFMHGYLSWACEGLLRSYEELEGGIPERGYAPWKRFNIAQRSCYRSKVVLMLAGICV